MANHPSLTIYNQQLPQYIHTGYDLVTLDTSCNFTEGPVWNSGGFYLFSDIPENIIYKLTPGGKKEVFIQDSGCTHNDREDLGEQIGSNGLAYDLQGNLLICQHGNHAVAQYNGREVVPFITGVGDRPFNSPNDIICTSEGKVFFSDPPYGLKDQTLRLDKYQQKAGMYCWFDGEVLLVTDYYKFPNGVCLSLDEKILYTCSSKPTENVVLRFDAETLKPLGELCRENSDGIKCDRRGNLYLAAKEGVVILNAQGKRIGLIQLDSIPANLCWGGPSGNDLFITARQNIFYIPNLQKET